MAKNIGKSIDKNLNFKYSQNFLDHAKQSATYALKMASKEQFKNIRSNWCHVDC